LPKLQWVLAASRRTKGAGLPVVQKNSERWKGSRPCGKRNFALVAKRSRYFEIEQLLLHAKARTYPPGQVPLHIRINIGVAHSADLDPISAPLY
jgi:hypothetical protein